MCKRRANISVRFGVLSRWGLARSEKRGVGKGIVVVREDTRTRRWRARRPQPHQNHLLDALPPSDYERLSPHLELVRWTWRRAYYEPGADSRYVYFPTTSIVSLLYVLEDGASAEIAVVGNEGILGLSLVLGGKSTPSRAVVQSAGLGFRLKAQL